MDDPVVRPRYKVAIEICPAFPLDVAADGSTEFRLGPLAQPFGGQLTGAATHAGSDVAAGNDQVFAPIVLTPQDYVDVRIVSISVIDCDPLQARSQIPFDPRYERARKVA